MKINTKFLFVLSIMAFEVMAVPSPKTMGCIGCHGMDGNAFVPAFPSLASLPSEYIVEQLKAFRSGDRNNNIMTGVALGLKEEDLKEIGDYYESQNKKPISSKLPPAKLKILKLGERLYNKGNPETGQAACFVCHGNSKKPTLTNIGVPGLRAQSPTYIYQELLEFKNRTRTTDRERAMRRIVDPMSKEDLEAVSYYASQMDNYKKEEGK